MSMSDNDLDRVLHGTLFGEGVTNADVAAFLADERGNYVAVNEEACRLTGYTRARLTRFRAGELGADEASRHIYERLTTGKKLQGQKRIRREDGTVVTCRYWGIPTTVARLPYFLLFLWANGTAASPAS
jgi:PAS domain S-box-containing protein